MKFLSIRVLITIQALAFVWMPRLPAQSADKPPNVVMIISDDHRWSDYGFMGHPAIRTPHLDRLASRSAVFRRGYVPMALCRPSLMTMITGRYPYQHGITGNDPSPSKTLTAEQYNALKQAMIDRISNSPTIPRVLQGKGYLSHQSGKWWEGSFRNGGFTHGMTRGFPEKDGRHGDDGLTIGRQGMKPVLDFISEAKTAEKPFFVWYAPFLPHAPHNPPERLLMKYQMAGRPIELAKYFAMVEWFDETCGELINCLDAEGLTENTLIVYCCDNGWVQATPESGLPETWKNGFAPRSKQSPYDGGVRTPIMFSWPGVIPPSDRSEPISTIDLMPTILAAASAEAPADLPGLNLFESIRDQKPIEREFLYGESFGHDVPDLSDPDKALWFRWCIQGRWKLILSYDGEAGRYGEVKTMHQAPPQLFDINADPDETTNLADQHPSEVAQLRSTLDSIRKTRQK